MTKSLTPDAIAAYHARGYHFPLRSHDSAAAAGLLERLRASERLCGGKLGARQNQRPHLLFPWLDALIRHPAILDAVEDVIGPDILCWGGGFFMKDAGDGTFVSWHQDATYWGLSSPDVCSAWLAFTPSTRESGCMRVVPGTHRTQMAHKDTFAEKNLLSRGQEVAVAVDEREAVDITLQPGEFSLHHVLIVHGSEPNRASWPRIGLAIRYVASHVRQTVGDTDWATLVRGENRHGNFMLTTPPKSDLHPDAIAHHAAVMDHQLAYLYRGATQRGKLGPTPGATAAM
jgi:ectoine hydroxylase-related dioxygenase (phytanoyl-CoA dioxygenase family)